MKKNLRYDNEVHKRLEVFKSALEWSDFIGLLGSLNAVFERYSGETYIPHYGMLVKRLNQCLNPALPAGVHLKALETYSVIFNKLPRDSLIADFTILTTGLFNFGMNCRIIVTGEYLELIKQFIVPIAPHVPIRNILLALFPTLESESSEFYIPTLLLLNQLHAEVSPEAFFDALWRIFIEFPSLGISIINFVAKERKCLFPDWRFGVRAFCAGLKSDSLYVIRHMLELVPCNYPLGEASDGSPEDTAALAAYNTRLLKDALQLFLKKEASLNKRVFKWLSGTGKDRQGIIFIERGLRAYIGTSEADIVLLLRILFSLSDDKDLAPKVLERIVPDMIKAMIALNADNTKFRKGFSSLGLDYIYRTFYLNLSNSLNISNSDDKAESKLVNCNDINRPENEDVADECVDDLNVDGDSVADLSIADLSVANLNVADKSMADVSVADKSVADLSIADKSVADLSMADESIADLSITDLSIAERSMADLSMVDLSVADETTSEKNDSHTSNFEMVETTHSVDDLLTIIIYTIGTLDGIDSNAKTIHIPLLANLIVRNKGRISDGQFHEFMDLFISIADRSTKTEAGDISLPEIAKAYETKHLQDFAGMDLIGLVAEGFSCLDFMPAEGAEVLEFKDGGELVMRNGILVYGSQLVDPGTMTRKAPDDIGTSGRNGLNIAADIYDCREFSTTSKNLYLIQRFIEKFTITIFQESQLRLAAAALIRDYKFKALIEVLHEHIVYEELYKTMWQDFARTKVPDYLVHYEFSHFVIDDLSYIDKKYVFILLSKAIDYYKYFDVLFALSNIVEQSCNEFVALLLRIQNPIPFLKYILKTYNESGTYSNAFKYISDPNYNRIRSLLQLLSGSLNSNAVMDALFNNYKVKVDRFDDDGVTDCIVRMLVSLIVVEDDISDGIESMADSNVLVSHSENSTDAGNLSTIAKSVSLSQRRNDPQSIAYMSEMPSGRGGNALVSGTRLDSPPISGITSISALSNFGGVQRKAVINASQREIQRMALRLLHKMNKRGVKLEIPWLDRLKRVIIQHKDAYYIMSKSLFLVEDDLDFIVSHYLKNYREVFTHVAEMPIKNAFFKLLLKRTDVLTVDMLIAMHPHIAKIAKFDWAGYYDVAMRLVSEDGAALCFREIADNSESISSSDDEAEPTHGYEPPKIMLMNLLYETNPRLFAEQFIAASRPESIFAILPFKEKLFSQLVKPTYFIVLEELVEYISPEKRAEIFKCHCDYLKGAVYSRIDVHGTMLILKLILPEGTSPAEVIVPSEKYKPILDSILYGLETRIASGIKLEFEFRHDILILHKMGPLIGDDSVLIVKYKACLFGLLLSPKYAKAAFELVDAALRLMPRSRPLLDGLFSYFNENFFAFDLQKKSELLNFVASEPTFDVAPILERLLSGLGTSYFLSQQNSTLQKVHAIRRIAFFLVSLPYDALSGFSDRLVMTVNILLANNSDLRAETYRLVIAMLLRIEHSQIAHLYPIILEEFMNTFRDMASRPSDFAGLCGLIRCVDICIWLKSEQLNFAGLLLLDKEFTAKCRALSEGWYATESELLDRAAGSEDSTASAIRMPALGSECPNLFISLGDKPDGIARYFENVQSYYDTMDASFATRDHDKVAKAFIASFSKQ